MLETLDYTIRIGSTPTFLSFDLYPIICLVVISLRVSIHFLHKGKLISNIFLETGGLVVTMDCKEFMIVGGSAGTQVGTNEGNMVLYVVDL